MKKIEAFLRQPSKPLQRSQSIDKIDKTDVVDKVRRKTLPIILDVENFSLTNPER